ncbi:uncharacterized protein LOC135610699 isoform X2 [Musa acuminata AAA Group]|uniref:uncharacterized protein LOC135610699 isoform X2 n=1 Tax=Musa acuminata AAA Group TaxID=214697 RepID=UPI0031D47748
MVRKQMEEDEQLATLMRGLRSQNLTDVQFADENIRLRLVEVPAVNSNEALPLVYDPDIIASYWGKRPRDVSTRIIQLLSVAGGFLSHLAWDLINKKIAEVPSFPDDVAMALIEEELGQPWCKIYSELTPSPIAAASLGQVYKGCLKETGELVAVKVQRPFVLETVTIDLFIIRKLGLFLRRFPQDEWAARIFEELDYVNEGENGTRFAEMMREDLPQVVIPKAYHKYTSRKVLTTQWIDGEKLSQSTESDVGELVNVGVICYLKQERSNYRTLKIWNLVSESA